VETETREVGVAETERGRGEEMREGGNKKETEEEKPEKRESDKCKLNGRRMGNLG